MKSPNPRSITLIGNHPIHAVLAPIPIMCFVGALITDVLYWLTEMTLWMNMSDWLVTVGVIFFVVTVFTDLMVFFGDSRVRELPTAWITSIGNAIVLILAFFNALVHTSDSYRSVVPTGLILSALVVLALLVTGWLRSGSQAEPAPVDVEHLTGDEARLVGDQKGQHPGKIIWRFSTRDELPRPHLFKLLRR